MYSYLCLMLLALATTAANALTASLKKDQWLETPLTKIENGEIFVVTHKNYPGDCLRTMFSVYWDIPTSQVITEEQEKQILSEYIIPAMKSKCPRMLHWDLSHYLKSKPLYDHDGDEIAFSGHSYIIHQERLMRGLKTTRGLWGWPSYDAAVAGVEEGRRAKEGSRRRGEEDRANRLADEQSRRKAKCDSESSGGKHPCGLVLAEEFIRVARATMPHCDKLLKHEWCTIDFGRTWVRWDGGTKHSCVPRKDKNDRDVLLCDFSPEWECKVRDMKTNQEVTSPAARGLLCAAFLQPARINALAVPSAGGWSVELLRK